MKYKNRIPLLILSITDRCNLRCPHCFKEGEMKNLNDLPLQDWKDAYDIFKPKVIQLFGGEPTLRWNDILEFLDYIYKENKQYHTITTFATNGTIYVDYETIPKEYRKYIINCFSLDGMERINDKARGKGSYQKTHDAIKRSIAADIKTSINCSCHACDYINNLNEYEEWIQYFYNIGISYVRLQTIFYPFEKDNLIRSEETYLAINLLRNLEVSKKYNIEVKDRSVTCHIQGTYISANGNLSPKCALMNKNYGNFRNWTPEGVIELNNYFIQNSSACDDIPQHLDNFAKGLQLKYNKKKVLNDFFRK